MSPEKDSLCLSCESSKGTNFFSFFNLLYHVRHNIDFSGKDFITGVGMLCYNCVYTLYIAMIINIIHLLCGCHGNTIVMSATII